jgi:hypothetical protein
VPVPFDRSDHIARIFAAVADGRRPAVIESNAKFSADRKYRYWLVRRWANRWPLVAIIGMNPSKAAEIENDSTVSRELHFAKEWGYGGLLKLNAYAYCATYPKDLWAARQSGVDIIGTENTAACLMAYLAEFKIEKVVAAWGRLRTDRGWLLRDGLGIRMDCLGLNGDGSPRHPLYLSYTTPLQPFNYG